MLSPKLYLIERNVSSKIYFVTTSYFVRYLVAISRDDRKFYLGERAVEISRFQRFHI